MINTTLTEIGDNTADDQKVVPHWLQRSLLKRCATPVPQREFDKFFLRGVGIDPSRLDQSRCIRGAAIPRRRPDLTQI